MSKPNEEFLKHMLRMSATVIDLALDAMERQPEDMERKKLCLETLRTTAGDLRKLAVSETCFPGQS